MSNLHPIFDDLTAGLCVVEIPDDSISRLDLWRFVDDEMRKVRARLNPLGAFYHTDSGRLQALAVVLEQIERAKEWK